MALFNKTYLPLLILKLLDEEQMWGYRLCQVIRERTQGELQFKEGTVYPLLRDLEQGGFIAGEWRPSPDGPERKYYHLTGRGQRMLSTEKPKLAAFARLWMEGPAHAPS